MLVSVYDCMASVYMTSMVQVRTVFVCVWHLCGSAMCMIDVQSLQVHTYTVSAGVLHARSRGCIADVNYWALIADISLGKGGLVHMCPDHAGRTRTQMQ